VTLLCCHYDGAQRDETIDGIRIVRRGKRNTFNFVVPAEYKRLRKQTAFDIVVDDINKIPFYTPLYVKEPILAIVHHFFSKTIFLEVPFLQANYVYWSEKLVPFIYRNTPFAAVSESSRQELMDVGIKSDIHLLPNAIHIADYPMNPALKSPTPLIGYLGRLKKYKSVNHLLDAMPEVFKVVSDAKLMIIGDGDDRPRLERQAKSLGIADRVIFTGYVSHQQKVKLLQKIWCVANPSPKEGWGLTVIESNACGCPVIAADSPGLRDSVVDGQTGWLYPYGDIQALADRLIKLLENPTLRKKFSVNARNWAQKFNWDHSAQKAIEIIDATLTD